MAFNIRKGSREASAIFAQRKDPPARRNAVFDAIFEGIGSSFNLAPCYAQNI